jgi:hypothetical protein
VPPAADPCRKPPDVARGTPPAAHRRMLVSASVVPTCYIRSPNTALSCEAPCEARPRQLQRFVRPRPRPPAHHNETMIS